jgi:hypothetical protein
MDGCLGCVFVLLVVLMRGIRRDALRCTAPDRHDDAGGTVVDECYATQEHYMEI